MQKNKRSKFTLTFEIVNNLIVIGSPEYQIFKTACYLMSSDLRLMCTYVGQTTMDIIAQVQELDLKGVEKVALEEEPTMSMPEAEIILRTSRSSLNRMIARGEITCRRSPRGFKYPFKSSVYAYKKSKEEKLNEPEDQEELFTKVIGTQKG